MLQVIEAVRRRMQQYQDPDSDLTSAPPPPKKNQSSTDDELFGDLMLPKSGDLDDLDRYIQMAEADIGDDSDILKWWELQVRFAI